MNRDTVRQIVNVIAVIATIAVNGLATGLPINGQTTGEISDRFDVFFVPAGYVFSIWGVIYLGLLAFAVYQALPAQRENPRLRRIGYLFLLSCVANSAWIFLWHYELFALSLLVMVALLVTLVLIYMRLAQDRPAANRVERWVVDVPFSIYLGWITVATIANATSLLDYLGWSGWGISPEIWTAVMLGAAVIIAFAMSVTQADVAYLLVLVWAFIGIAVKHAGTPFVFAATWVATALVIIAIVLALLRTRAIAARPA